MDGTWQIRKRTLVAQPVDLVFDYLTRWDRVGEWDRSVVAAERTSAGPPAAGSRFQLTLAFGGRRIPMTYVITAAERPRRIELEGQAPVFRAVDRIRLEPVPGGTELSYEVTIAFDRPPRGLAGVLGKRVLAFNATRAIRRLRTVLAGVPTPPRLTLATRMADQALLPGLLGFTRLGHALAVRRRPVASILYRDRTVVLTGATSGIGRAAARALYRRGAHLVAVGRSAEKLAGLERELNALGGAGTIATERADLSLLAEVRILAERLVQRYERIDVLINNAGALFNRFQQTAEGIEKTMATDLVAPFLLTRLLLPALRAAGSARIVNVASGGMYTQGVRAPDLTPEPAAFHGPAVYARAKRGLVILTARWARQWAPAGISVHAMHPGWVATPGLAVSLPGFYRRLAPWLRTPAQGADTIVWLAAAPDAARASGHFWLDRKIRATHVIRRTRTTMQEDAALVQALDLLCKRW